MATGAELFIGVKGKGAIDALASELGVTLAWNRERVERSRLDEINKKLEEQWGICIEKMGGFRIVGRSGMDGRYYAVETPVGFREMVAWDLELYYDPWEMGEYPEDAVFGVSLIRRYFPTFLDWREEHGGSGCVISLSKETLDMIKRARKYLARVVPQLKNAEIHVKEMFY